MMVYNISHGMIGAKGCQLNNEHEKLNWKFQKFCIRVYGINA